MLLYLRNEIHIVRIKMRGERSYDALHVVNLQVCFLSQKSAVQVLGGSCNPSYLAVIDVASGMQDDLVGDDLDVARLKRLAEVELGVLCYCCKCPADIRQYIWPGL